MFAYRYQVYGIQLENEVAFPGLLPASSKNQNVTAQRIVFRRRRFLCPEFSNEWFCVPHLAYRVSPDRRFVFIRTFLADTFRVDLEKKIIDWNPPEGIETIDSARRLLVLRVLELPLAASVPSLLLHACVVRYDSDAICFMGPSGQGKSTLAVSLLAEGFSILADDLAVIQRQNGAFVVQPGLPEIRLRPDAEACLQKMQLPSRPAYPETGKKSFFFERETNRGEAETPVRLRAIYLLSRQEEKHGEVKIQCLGGQEALLTLVKNTCHLIVESRRILEQYFELTSQLIEKVPFARLVYPSGFSRLAQVHRAVFQDTSTPALVPV